MFMLKNFFCLLKLETGGLIIGTIHLLIYTAFFVFCATYLTIYDCSDFERFLTLPENRICQFNRDFVVLTWLVLLTAIVLAYFCYRNCIKGIREKDFMLLGPFVSYLAVITILSLCHLYNFTIGGVLIALIQCSITGYMYIVVNSHYVQLRDGPASKLVGMDDDV
ncbi:uncharacterized protein LOC119079124 [Bradysia coprophila]|uniref:uncharacterized protein LOC119079124 n=1 Tax=Bradysia coprophila TaxID=38358 RepID=UPI00187D8409|nr:uncharacterized protein LOC119079124 [Bradysia coprophila]